MKESTRRLALVLASLGLVACGHDFEPPDRGARVELAAARYSTSLFDTIAWHDSAVRTQQGNMVYAEKCRRCHGRMGEGGTDYARGRGLIIPPLTRPDWPFSELDTLRRMLYVGHEVGMPIYGEGRLSVREIDATAAYILLTLRPEVAEQR